MSPVKAFVKQSALPTTSVISLTIINILKESTEVGNIIIMGCIQSIRNPMQDQIIIPASLLSLYQESTHTVAMIKHGVVKTTSIEKLFYLFNISGSKRKQSLKYHTLQKTKSMIIPIIL